MATNNLKKLQYQVEAVDDVVLRMADSPITALQAPTGSGKTLMTAKIVEELLKAPEFIAQKTTFIFIAPSSGALDHQGYEKITEYKNKGWAKGFDTQYIGTAGGKTVKSKYLENINSFEENTIYFMGWSILSKNGNTLKIDSERNNLFKVIENTKERDINVVLIVDEAHREYPKKNDKKGDSEIRRRFLEELNPSRILEISATLNKPDEEKVIVSLEDVRKEAAIRKNVIVNSNDESDMSQYDNIGHIEKLLRQGKDKLEAVSKAYWDVKLKKKPLMLIQIPDNLKKVDDFKLEDYYKDNVKKTLDSFGWKIGVDYVLWLADDKTIKDKSVLTDSESTIKAIIFKQAIATGWDIPRANILIKLRNPKKGSDILEVQTLGRILRNPFFTYFSDKSRANRKDANLIDNAFVYTNDEGYKDRIAKESFVKRESESKIYNLSDKAKNNRIKINKIKQEISIRTKDIVLKASSALSKYDKRVISLVKGFDYDQRLIEDVIATSTISAEEILGEEYRRKTNVEKIIIQRVKNAHKEQMGFNFKNLEETTKHLEKIRTSKGEKIEEQTKWALINSKDTLLDLYVKYRSNTSESGVSFKVIENYISHLSVFDGISKKDIYKFMIYNYSEATVDGELTMKDLVAKTINEVIKENSIPAKEEFELTDTLEMDSKIGTNESWDEINSYELMLDSDNLDSDGEKFLYEGLLSVTYGMDNFHIFRNGVSGSKSYYVEYYSSDLEKVSKFYPDFIAKCNNNIWIAEVKGDMHNDIDKKTNLKMKALNKHSEKLHINDKEKVIISKVVFPSGIKSPRELRVIWEVNGVTESQTLTQFIQFLKEKDQ